MGYGRVSRGESMMLTGKTQFVVDAEKLQIELKEEQTILQVYLDSTDWYVTRLIERNINIPDDVKAKRLESINRINEIKEL